jgi:hypothetical protein
MSHLKAVIFGLRDVILHQGPINSDIYQELGRLLKLIQTRKITPVFLANKPWQVQLADKSARDVQEMITKDWGKFPWYVANRDGLPRKPTKEATAHVLETHGWKPHEVMYVGNTVDDMRTAVNGGLLFLNAKWHGQATEYGFEFHTPSAIGRFIDVFCTRDSLWYYKIEDGALRMYAMGLYSTHDREAQQYAGDARDAAKFGGGTASFWRQYLISTLYLSGLCEQFDYAAPFPGHSAKSKKAVTHDDMVTLTKCFRASYLPDLIVRHTTAMKSQMARLQGKGLDHRNQLNTIQLTQHPLRGNNDKRYKANPLHKGKIVLVIDDICTEGYSLDAARNFIEQTGARAVLVAWTKTPNRSYYRVDLKDRFSPFKPQNFAEIPKVQLYPYSKHIADADAPGVIAKCLAAYKKWDWPKEVK